MPAVQLCAHFTDTELTLRTQARVSARPTLPDPVAIARALALAICEVEAGLRSASGAHRSAVLLSPGLEGLSGKVGGAYGGSVGSLA